ncbi:MAG: ABC transporter substrate-binding protein [Chitinivibrionales bacterium]|nr:ABC transporter substrate-binding protein [Chitinivibrionales bacterium]MBD3355561.1 ABC transporter substrate-binding protein [Chitinivibrionales bacterium]
MKRIALKTIVVIGVILPTILIMGCGAPESQSHQSKKKEPQRIISLAPSITETLFALGLGERVVAVTKFCEYPEAARRLPRVGGYMDPNYEAIVRHNPDLVILMTEHTSVQSFLRTRQIPYLAIDNHNFDGILSSFEQIGEACGRIRASDSLVSDIRAELAESGGDYGMEGPRVLLCVGRDNVGSGKIARVYAAGRRTFYDELLEAVGAVNAYPDSSIKYPRLSAEGVSAAAPDIIIDLMASMNRESVEDVRNDWERLTFVPAVDNDMVFCLTGKYLTIPGPRIIKVFRDFRGIVEKFHANRGAKAAHRQSRSPRGARL